MTGKALAFTERDRAIVREVARFGVMSRDQLMRLKFFSSKTRAKERLKRLVDEGYLDARCQPIPVGGPRFVYLPGRLVLDAREVRRRLRIGGTGGERHNNIAARTLVRRVILDLAVGQPRLAAHDRQYCLDTHLRRA